MQCHKLFEAPKLNLQKRGRGLEKLQTLKKPKAKSKMH